jgi:predicted Co/Zn/Cd cation transporter (cation efflux family)
VVGGSNPPSPIIYFSKMKKGSYKGIAAGLSLYMIHWFVEIINAIIQHLSCHALWTVPTGTAYLIFVGVGIELSLMFSIAGLAVSKLLPDDPKEKMFSIGRFGVPKPLAIGIGNAALASIIEIFLIYTPTFVWVWEWWNAFTVFIFVYIPFFVVACYAYYWEPKKQRNVIGIMALINAILIIVFGTLGWI